MVKPIRRVDILILVASMLAILLSVAVQSQQVMVETISEADRLTWYLIRGTGIVSYVLMAGSMIWGLWLTSGLAKSWSPGAVSNSVHVTLSWLGISFGVIHALLLLVDDAFPHTLLNLIIPFSDSYNPIAGGLGVMGLWLMILIALSVKFKKRLKRKGWKLLHLTSYLSFGMVTVHTVMAGSDVDLLGLRLLLVGSVSAIILFLTIRVIRHRKL